MDVEKVHASLLVFGYSEIVDYVPTIHTKGDFCRELREHHHTNPNTVGSDVLIYTLRTMHLEKEKGQKRMTNHVIQWIQKPHTNERGFPYQRQTSLAFLPPRNPLHSSLRSPSPSNKHIPSPPRPPPQHLPHPRPLILLHDRRLASSPLRQQRTPHPPAHQTLRISHHA